MPQLFESIHLFCPVSLATFRAATNPAMKFIVCTREQPQSYPIACAGTNVEFNCDEACLKIEYQMHNDLEVMRKRAYIPAEQK
jgi:hypothetical protein